MTSPLELASIITEQLPRLFDRSDRAAASWVHPTPRGCRVTTDEDVMAKVRRRELRFYLLVFAMGLFDGLMLGWWLL